MKNPCKYSIIVFLSLMYALCSQAESIPDSTKIKLLYERASRSEYNNLDSAFLYTKKAYMLSQKTNNKLGLSSGFYRFGNIYLIKGQNDSALQFLQTSVKLCQTNHDKKTLGLSWIKISQIYKILAKKDSAYSALYQALSVFEEAKDSIGMANALNGLAELSFNYGDTPKAFNYLNQTSDILTRNQDTLLLSLVFTNYGIIYYGLDKYQLALEYFIKAKVIHEKINHLRFLAKDFNFLGICYESLGKDKICLMCFNEALRYFTLFNQHNNKLEVLFNISVYYFNRNNPDSSIVYLTKIKNELKSNETGNVLLRTYSLLSDVYASKNDYLKAYDYHVKYSNLSDSLLNTNKVKQIAEMQTKYETEKKNQQLTLLGEQFKTRTAERNVFITSCILLFVLLIASGLYLRQRNRIAKKNEQLAQEKISSIIKEQEIKSYNAMLEGQDEERKRIAIDLHDRIGSILSTVKLLFGALDEKIDKAQEENVKQYNQATSLLDEAVSEVRRISHNLSAGIVTSFGLVAALEELCDSIHNSKIIRCKLLYFGLNSRLEPIIEIGIYRMIQEMINNILKHAKAKRITVQLNRTSESINITVEDDGMGFNVAEKMKSGGMGLKNLEARAAKLNGVYNIDSKPGRGTISIIEIPLTEYHD